MAVATSTTVSPYCTRQLPAACLANSPVSRERIDAPICRSTRTFKICSYLHLDSSCRRDAGESVTEVGESA